MKYVDEYRDPRLARELLESIRRRATRPWVLMEVCGGQTHSLLRHGIDSELAGTVELIHGPGCPVCVTPTEAIDFAQDLAQRPDMLLASFGDMLRVPGSGPSLIDIRARGGEIRIVYSPLDAVELARREPNTQVVFFAVGFETTTPATALAVLQAERYGLQNFSLLVAHVRVQPAMEALMQADDCLVQGFLAAGHVCTVVGYESYEEFVARYRVPVVVTGFEPVDLLAGILECVDQLETGRFEVVNRYARSVRHAGNAAAKDIVGQVFEPADRPWRGLGTITGGGLRLRPEFRRFDAEQRFGVMKSASAGCATDCRSGDVLAGRIRPIDCPSFGTKCTPDAPLGAPMVSSEGACAPIFATVGASPWPPSVHHDIATDASCGLVSLAWSCYLGMPKITEFPLEESAGSCRKMRVAIGPDFEKTPLLPVIAQDEVSGVVLMLAYMNEAAYQESLATGRVCYFSRSRNKLWRKGEESGNVQEIKAIYYDCDADTLLIKVNQVGGAACHEGYQSCFFRKLSPDGNSFEVVGERVFDPATVYKKP